jgi:hypothetical protein
MGWEMVRAGAIHKTILNDLKTTHGIDLSNGIENADLTNKETALAAYANKTLDDFYTAGRGTGLSFMNLPGFCLVTDANTVIAGNNSNSMREGGIYRHNTAEGPLRTSGIASLHPAVRQMSAIGNYWFEDDNKGMFHSTPDSDWIFQKDIGYLFHHPETHWYYSTKDDLGWLYIHDDHVTAKPITNSKAINGFLYSAGLQAWIYVSVTNQGDGATTTFYHNTQTKDWKILQ